MARLCDLWLSCCFQVEGDSAEMRASCIDQEKLVMPVLAIRIVALPPEGLNNASPSRLQLHSTFKAFEVFVLTATGVPLKMDGGVLDFPA